jgi:restriction endonuclease S subunit
MINLNKNNWITTKIGNVAVEIKEKVPSLLNYSDAKFVRPEDLEIGNYYVKSFHSAEGVVSGKKCYANNILFARRSVSVSQFKRRSCVLKFDAICSDELTVIKENISQSKQSDCLQQGFLNLILNTKALWDFGIGKSVGSVSKRIKWEDLSKYEFNLPPKEEQQQIVDLFLTLETQIEQMERQASDLRELAKGLINNFVENGQFGNLIQTTLKSYLWKNVVRKLLRKIDPEAAGIERIVKGEDMRSENFSIKTWDTVGKDFLGPAFHVLFEAGDILYGSRRTYLKKVALADFKGVCSNTTFVIRANEGILLQNLLKHIMLSDKFTQYSIAKSKGSTNPYINWKDLDDFELKLPDLFVQQKIVSILDSIIDLAELCSTQTQTLKQLKQTLLDEILGV